MRRATFLLLATVAMFTIAGIASAGPFDAWRKVVDPISRDFHRNNCWPAPFVKMDAQAVNAPFATMVRNGWRLQNVMGSHHFDNQTNELTSAGQAKVRAILLDSPHQHRTVFVQRSRSMDVTKSRIDAVQREAQRVLPEGELPAVEHTDLSPPGWPAAQIDAINRSRETSAPVPQLPNGGAAAGGGAGGG